MKYLINCSSGTAYSDNHTPPNDKSNWIQLKLSTCLIQLADCFQQEFSKIVNPVAREFIHHYLMAFEQLGLQITEPHASHIALVFKNLTFPMSPFSLDSVMQSVLKSCLSQNIILQSSAGNFILYEDLSEASVLHITDTVTRHKERVRNIQLCQTTNRGNKKGIYPPKIELNCEGGNLWLNIHNVILIQELPQENQVWVYAVGRKPILVKQTLSAFYNLIHYHFVPVNNYELVNLQHIVLNKFDTQCTVLTMPTQLLPIAKIYQHSIWEQWTMFLIYMKLKQNDLFNFFNTLKMTL